MDQVLEHVKNEEKLGSESSFIKDLISFVNIPSVNTGKGCTPELKTASLWLQQRLTEIGFSSEIVERDAHTPPLVIAKDFSAGKGAPTLLIYNHYDVQPTGNLNEWNKSPDPFSGNIIGDRIYGRGVMDNKGQLLINLYALEAIKRSTGSLPINIVIAYEGEEEGGGSEFLAEYIARPDFPKVDFVLVSDGPMIAVGQPTLTVSTRGSVRANIKLSATNNDLHSGMYGGAVLSASDALVSLLATCVDTRSGKILIEGVNDGLELNQKLLQKLDLVPRSEQEMLEELGVKSSYGDATYSHLVRMGLLPCFSTLGMKSGGLGVDLKSVINAQAEASVEIRTAPGQDGAYIASCLKKHLEDNTPEQVSAEISVSVCADPYVTNPESKFLELAEKSLKATFNKEVAYDCCGGSLPILAQFKKVLEADTLMMDYGQHDSNMHGPDENLHLPTFWKGIECTVRFVSSLKS